MSRATVSRTFAIRVHEEFMSEVKKSFCFCILHKKIF